MTSPSRMQIGELAELAGVSDRTIRYYERIGLLAPVQREGTGYRHYDESSLKRLQKIAVLKRLGLSLTEIGQVIDLYFDGSTGLKGKEKVLEILSCHLAEVDSRMQELTLLKQELAENIERVKICVREAQEA